MKKVLIALDYNPTAQKVAEVGFSFDKRCPQRIIEIINKMFLKSRFMLKYYIQTNIFNTT